jgi:hypothetical protein
LQTKDSNWRLFALDKYKKMKLYFTKIAIVPTNELVTYSSMNPIPATLKFINSEIGETVYARNIAGENFIEFRFNTGTKRLYEIAVVAIQEDTVKFGIDNWAGKDEFYECYIVDENELDISIPIQVLRSDNSLCFFWGTQPSHMYSIAKNCMLGVDTDKNLCSVLLINLSSEVIYGILGF